MSGIEQDFLGFTNNIQGQNPVYVKTNNEDGYPLLFPFELSNLDYIRRILDFLKEGLIIFVDFGIRNNREIWEQYDKIEKEGNKVDDSYYILKCLKNSHVSWANQFGYSPNDIFVSLSFLFSLRNSFSHQNKDVSILKNGKAKIYSKNTVFDAFNHSKYILSICSIIINNAIDFTLHNIGNLEKQFNEHLILKKQRKSFMLERYKQSEQEEIQRIRIQQEQYEERRKEEEKIEQEERMRKQEEERR